MAWGLPMLTTDGECNIGLSIDPICSSMARVSSNFWASGISFHAQRGLPMSTVETSGTGRARRMQRHQLVVWRAVGLRRRARLGRTDRSRLPAHVDHHDLIAEAVHLDEGMVGERAHGRPVVGALYGQIGREGQIEMFGGDRRA